MFKKKYLFTFILLASILFLVCPVKIASADDDTPDMTGPSWSVFGSVDPKELAGEGDIGFGIAESPETWLERMAENAISYIFLLGMILAPLLILIGAFMFFTSGGDPYRVARGKALVLWAAIGLAVLLFGRAILAILKFLLDF